MTDNMLLTELEEIFYSVLFELYDKNTMPQEDLAEIVKETHATVQEEIKNAILSTFRKTAPQMLKERRAQLKAFEKRNFSRWKKAFDLSEMLIVIAEELGEANDKALRSEAINRNDLTFEALSQLHPRAILISREIMCLLKGGYPDGALARWRSLHELTVTAMFISQEDLSVAHKYLASFAFSSFKAATQMNEYAERANLDPFTDEEIHELKSYRDSAEREIGESLESDYDWAKGVINKGRVTFRDIEKHVNMDHWRPRYRWASQHLHSGHRPPDRLLGLVEAQQPVLLVGPSNSGFTDPLQMTAISLSQMTSTFLMHIPNLDRLIHSKIVMQLAEEIGPLSQQIEQETLKRTGEDRANTNEH